MTMDTWLLRTDNVLLYIMLCCIFSFTRAPINMLSTHAGKRKLPKSTRETSLSKLLCVRGQRKSHEKMTGKLRERARCGISEIARRKKQDILTLLGPQSRFGDKLLTIWVVCPLNGTAVLNGLTTTNPTCTKTPSIPLDDQRYIYILYLSHCYIVRRLRPFSNRRPVLGTNHLNSE